MKTNFATQKLHLVGGIFGAAEFRKLILLAGEVQLELA